MRGDTCDDTEQDAAEDADDDEGPDILTDLRHRDDAQPPATTWRAHPQHAGRAHWPHTAGGPRAQSPILIDGYVYAGSRAHQEMQGSEFIVTDRLQHSYITTASLRRSGEHPERVTIADEATPTKATLRAMQQLRALPELNAWIRGDGKPHSTLLAQTEAHLSSTVVLHAFKRPVTIRGRRFLVVPSNEKRVIMGYDMAAAVDAMLEADPSPMQAGEPTIGQGDVANYSICAGRYGTTLASATAPSGVQTT